MSQNIFDQIEFDLKSRVKANLSQNISPETAIELQRINAPIDDEIAKNAESRKNILLNQQIDGINYEEMQKYTPGLLGWIIDKKTAPIIKDDWNELGFFERRLNNVKDAMKAVGSGASAIVGSGAWLSENVGYGLSYLSSAVGADQLAKDFENAAGDFRDVKNASYEVSQGLALDATKNYGVVGKGFYNAVSSLTTQSPGILATIAKKNPFMMAGWAFFQTYTQSETQALKQGLSRGDAMIYGGAQAAIESGFEYIGAKVFVKDLVKNTGFMKMLVNQLAVEIPTEMATTIGQNLTENLMLPGEDPSNPNNIEKYLKNLPADLRDTVVTTFWQTLMMTGGANIYQRKFKEQAEIASKIDAQANIEEGLKRLSEEADATKLKTRSPELMQRFVSESTIVNDVKELYLSQEKLKEFTQQEVDSMPASIKEQIDSIIDDSHAITVSIADFLATDKATQEKLSRLLTVEPDGMTLSELETEGNRLTEEIKTEIDRVSKDKPFVYTEIKTKLKSITDDKSAGFIALAYDQIYSNLADQIGITPQELYSQSPIDFTIGTSEKSRGGYDAEKRLISIYQNSDPSTLIHESGHFFLDLYTTVTKQDGIPQKLREDADGLMKYLGFDSIEAFINAPQDERTAAHEKMAESIEVYFSEGKPPVDRLKNPFRAFKNWMFGSYKYLNASSYTNVGEVYNIQLDQNIKDIFARMFYFEDLSSKQINRAGLDIDIDMSDLTEVERASYAQTKSSAVNAVSETMTAIAEMDIAITSPNAKISFARVEKDLKYINANLDRVKKLKAIKDFRAATTEKTKIEISSLPVVKAHKIIQSGELGGKSYGKDSMKLDSKEVRSIAKALGIDPSGLMKYTKKDGMSIEYFNALTGLFQTSNSLLENLASFSGEKTMVDAAVDAKMYQKYGKLKNAFVTERELNSAISNKDYLLKLYEELTITKGRVDTINNEMRKSSALEKKITLGKLENIAYTYVQSKKIKELKDGYFIAASKKSALDFYKLFKNGQYEEALTKKRAQLFNISVLSESVKTKKRIEQHLKYFEKVRSKSSAKAIGYDYHQAILQVLDAYDFAKKTNVDDGALRKFVLTQLQSGRVPDFVFSLLTKQQRKNFALMMEQRDSEGNLIFKSEQEQIDLLVSMIEQKKQMPFAELTVEEIDGLYSVVKHIENLGKKRDSLLNGESFKDIEENLSSHIKKFTGKVKTKKTYNRSKMSDRLQHGFDFFISEALTAGNVVNIIDNGDDMGVFFKSVLEPLIDADVKSKKMNIEYAGEVYKILYPLYEKQSVSEKTGSGIQFDSLGMELNWRARMAVLLNVGNESNYSRLLSGGINRKKITPAQINEVISTLSKEDILAAQKIWDIMARLEPEITNVYREINGVEPEMITPRQITLIANDGSEVTLSGGYYPVVYDNWKSSEVQDLVDETGIKASSHIAALQARVNQSFLKSRVDQVIGKELVLDLDGMFSGLSQAIHYINFQKPSIDVSRILRSKKITNAIEETHGISTLKVIKDYFRDTVSANMAVTTAVDKVAGMIRQNIALARLSANVTSSVVNLSGFLQAAPKVGLKNLLNEVVALIANPSRMRDIRLSQEMMQIRDQTRTREISEVQASLRSVTKFREFATRWGYFLMQKTGAITDAIVWNASYGKNVSSMGEDAAAKQASIDVLSTQSGALDFNMSSFQRKKGVMQLFSVLYGYMNSQYNVLYNTYKTKPNVDFMMAVINVSIMPTLVATILRAALTGDEMDAESLLKKGAADVASNAIGLLPFVRELAFVPSSLVSNFGDYNGPSGTALIYDSGQAAKAIFGSIAKGFNGENPFDKKLLKALVTVAGDATGIPSAQINKTVDAADKLLENNNNELGNYTGLIFGNKRK